VVTNIGVNALFCVGFGLVVLGYQESILSVIETLSYLSRNIAC